MQELPRRTAKKTRREATVEPLNTASSTATATKDEDGHRSGLAEDDLSGALPQISAAAASSFRGTRRNSTSGSIVECWICFDPTSTPLNPIVTHRCRCRGSVGYVHQKCIDRWVIQQRNRTCRSCGAPYQLVHSAYPPGANLPLRPHERRVFLLKFLIKPLLLESAETLCCVLLRFVVLPLLLGLVYSFHRWPLLWWPMSTFAGSPERNLSYTASTGVPGSQVVLENEDGTYTLTESFLAWADAILFGLVLCTVMNAVAVGWEKWNHYFHAARERLARETARHAEEGELAQPAAMPPVGPLDFHEENDATEGVEERAEATEQGVNNDSPPAAPPHHDAALPDGFIVEGWRPQWGPLPAAEQERPLREDARDARQPGVRAEARAAAGEQHSGSDSDSDNGDSDSGSDTPYRLSFVDGVFDTIDWVKSGAGGGGIKRLLPSSMRQLCYGLALTLLLRTIWGRVVVALAFAGFIVSWRYRHTRNVLTTQKRRLYEVAERVPLLSQEAVKTLFGVYLVDAFFFYGALPELGGMMLHYAVAPYMDVGFDRGFLAFFHGLTVLKVTLYWVVGAVLVMLLTAMELTVVGPLFANGVDLFFVRSFDARWDSVLGYWRCVVTQVFDSDPPRIVRGFLRVAVVELLVLLVFVRVPFWGMLGCRDLLWGDGTVAQTGLPLKMSLSLGVTTGYDISADASLDEWRRTEVLRVLAERVLLPFGAMYAAGVREQLGPMFDSIPLDTIDLLEVTAASSTSVKPATRQLWEQVWGNMSDRSVFLFHLIDPDSAKRVAAESEGFRHTLERVQEPMEWLRVATSEDGVCNTVMVLSSSAEWLGTPERQPPVADLEAIVAPPFRVSEQQSTSTALAHQMVLDAWRNTYQEAMGRIASVLHPEAVPTPPSLYPEHDSVQEEPHTVSAIKCYMAALHLSYPYVSMGRWRALAYEWWSLLLLRNTFANYVVDVLKYVAAISTVFSCFAVYPLQRAQLRILFPVVRWIGQSVVHMEHYLFDPEQLRAVEGFVEQEGEDELVLPPMVEPLGFDRREEYVEEAAIPSYLLLRRVVVAVLFLVVASFMVWIVPVLCGTLLLCITRNALPVLVGAASLSFLCWNPTLFARSVILGTALTIAIVFVVPIVGIIYIGPFAQLLWSSYPTLVEETFERQYDVHQMVGPYTGSVTGGNGNADGDSDDDWESVDSRDMVDGDAETPHQDGEAEPNIGDEPRGDVQAVPAH
ncbi:putative Zn-finger domain protein [Leishmania mexicana MHOM/GT/2001/U1103]|uniref:Zn-finger domain protein n=1 Tax=Leishmania mexicana (strain MHOM/GT/2001/U1103) TaxID=929439 RepID=E9ALQ8_LEIMU|nr:putative Zn-finger domain protein [Leishmania mexicana MHOM/GT/2001/U1103]CBZ23863.1 putative Zn-finger domain protein [Leishmania mexicana MHOM/GT/2001/U1103]